MNDDDLAAMFRRSLNEHADDVEDRGGGRVEAAYAGLRRRRRLQALTAGLAAVVVLGPAAVWAAVGPSATTEASHRIDEGHPTGWRVESYDGVELRVPASWDWAYTPVADGGRLLQCRGRAYSPPTSSIDIRPPLGGLPMEPYVGRPAPGGEGCHSRAFEAASHVWFDSPIPVGSDPRTGVTVRVQGADDFNITVYDANAQQQALIVRSIHPVDVDTNGCPMRPPAATATAEREPTTVTSISVCIYYGARGSDGSYTATTNSREGLFYSTSIAGTAAASVAGAIQSAGQPRRSEDLVLCLGATPQGIALLLHSENGDFTYGVNPYDCRFHTLVYAADSSTHRITRRSAEGWLTGGVPLYAGIGEPDNRLSALMR